MNETASCRYLQPFLAAIRKWGQSLEDVEPWQFEWGPYAMSHD